MKSNNIFSKSSYKIAAGALALGAIITCIPADAQTRLSLRDHARLMEARQNQQPSLKAFSTNADRIFSATESLLPDKENRVGVILKIEEGTDLSIFQANGLEEAVQVGSYIVANVPLDKIEALAASNGVQQIQLEEQLHHHNDKALQSSGIDQLQNGTIAGLQAYRGTGVLVGAMDSGVDPSHVTFLDAEGNCRIKHLWLYSTTGTVREYSESEISRFSYDDRTMTHGTHVLGTIAGSCTTTDKGNDFHGIAPEADIIVCCGQEAALTTTNILKGVEAMANYAKAEGRPIVINLSVGDNYGPHDGTDAFPAALNELAADDNVTLVLSAGNEADKEMAVVKGFTTDDTTLRTILWRNSSLTGTRQSLGYFGIWSNDSRPLKVHLDLIENNESATPVKSWEMPVEGDFYIGQGTKWASYLAEEPLTDDEDFNRNYTNSLLGGHAEVDAANNRFNIAMLTDLILNSSTTANPYIALRIEGEPGQTAYVYSTGAYVQFADNGYPGYQGGGGEGSISNMASGKETISVGSYVSKNVPGSGYATQTIGTISGFSSYGTLADGRVLPDICAPGQVITSAENYYARTYYGSDDVTTVNGNKHYWINMAGTSMATPHVTGSVALMLQANPQLTTHDIRRLFQETATPFSDSTPGGENGKLNLAAALKKAVEESGIGNITTSNNGEITVNPTGANIYEVLAPGESSINVRVNNMAGLMVKQINIAGVSGVIDLNSLPAGVYLLEITGNRMRHIMKTIVR